MMMSINRPDSLARQVSSFGLGGLASHPEILKLNKAQQEIILNNAANADANSDGALSLDEYAVHMVQVMHDVEAAAKKQAKLQHSLKLGGIWILLSWMGNFLLIFAVVALTQQLSPKDGNLVDSKTGTQLATRTGSHLAATPNADLIERRLAIQESGNDKDEVLRFLESTPLGTISKTQSEVRVLLARYTDNQSVTVTLSEGETTFFFTVNSISSFTEGNADTCDVYNKVEVSNSGVTQMVRVKCCPGDEYCSYFADYGNARRQLISNKGAG